MAWDESAWNCDGDDTARWDGWGNAVWSASRAWASADWSRDGHSGWEEAGSSPWRGEASPGTAPEDDDPHTYVHPSGARGTIHPGRSPRAASAGVSSHGREAPWWSDEEWTGAAPAQGGAEPDTAWHSSSWHSWGCGTAANERHEEPPGRDALPGPLGMTLRRDCDGAPGMAGHAPHGHHEPSPWLAARGGSECRGQDGPPGAPGHTYARPRGLAPGHSTAASSEEEYLGKNQAPEPPTFEHKEALLQCIRKKRHTHHFTFWLTVAQKNGYEEMGVRERDNPHSPRSCKGWKWTSSLASKNIPLAQIASPGRRKHSDGGFLYQHLLSHVDEAPWLVYKHEGRHGAYATHDLACSACCALLQNPHHGLGKTCPDDAKMISDVHARLADFLWYDSDLPSCVRSEHLCTIEMLRPGSVVSGHESRAGNVAAPPGPSRPNEHEMPDWLQWGAHYWPAPSHPEHEGHD